jgi:hypothetical protein
VIGLALTAVGAGTTAIGTLFRRKNGWESLRQTILVQADAMMSMTISNTTLLFHVEYIAQVFYYKSFEFFKTSNPRCNFVIDHISCYTWCYCHLFDLKYSNNIANIATVSLETVYLHLGVQFNTMTWISY